MVDFLPMSTGLRISSAARRPDLVANLYRHWFYICTGLGPRLEVRHMSGYGQFCPVAKAMELLDERWTMLVVRELLLGSTHFNDLRRGVPKMSPALLSKRLKSLTRAGVVRTRGNRRPHRVFAHPVREGTRRRGRCARRLGCALDRRTRRRRPRSASADVGHPPHDPDRGVAAVTHHAGVPPRRGGAESRHGGGWWWPTGRPMCAISIPATRWPAPSRPACAR